MSLSPSPIDAAAVDWQALPKVSLHEHIDGSLRPHTLWALSRQRGLDLPCATADEVADWMQTHASAGSLAAYLEDFRYTVAAMASEAACEQVARELAQDAQADGCVLAEFRFAPQLFTEWALSPEAATEAVLRGLQASSIPCGLIVCGMRHHPPAVTRTAAELAVRYASHGVVGFDLAGPEPGHPPTQHAEAIRVARDGGLGITLHAGEADAGHRVLEAGRLGATRIGHGVRVVDRPEWAEEARAMGLHFEVCPTSNVQTGAAPSVALHPVAAMLAAGLSVSCAPDNRLVSGTTLSHELQRLHTERGLDMTTLCEMQRQALQASFLPEPVKRKVAKRLTN